MVTSSVTKKKEGGLYSGVLSMYDGCLKFVEKVYTYTLQKARYTPICLFS